MKEQICSTEIFGEQDVHDFRMKLLDGISLLSCSEFTATRVATNFSVLMKQLLRIARNWKVKVELVQEHTGFGLKLFIRTNGKLSELLKQLSLENGVLERDQIVQELFNIADAERCPSEALKRIFNRKSRDQLLREVNLRNEDLNRTLKSLKETQQEKEQAQQQTLEKLLEINRIKEEANALLEQQVHARTKEIEIQKNEIEEKNKDILGSIQYAQRIQNAILPELSEIEAHFPDSFVLYEAKDIVSGDFFTVESLKSRKTGEDILVFYVADCTGHGVPGAFMSLIGNNFLKLSFYDPNVNSPAEVLDYVNRGIHSTLKAKGEEHIRDGMDIAICAYYPETGKLIFSGAKNSLYIIKNGELLELKGDRHPIGFYNEEGLKLFSNHQLQLEGGECLYLFSDGYTDQFGGPFSKKFRVSQFKRLLLENHHLPMKEQNELLKQTLINWKGDLEQIDDICIMGIRIE